MSIKNQDKALLFPTRKYIIIVLRLIVFSIVYLIAFQEQKSASFPLIIWFIAAIFLVSELAYLFEHRTSFFIQRILGWIFLFDTALITLLIYFLAIKALPLSIAYFAVIAMAAMSKSVGMTFAITALVSIFYLYLSASQGGFELTELLTRPLFFFGVAMFSSYLAEEVNKQYQEKVNIGQRFQNLVQHTNQLIVGQDLQGNINYVNPFFLRLTGYTSDNTIGRNWLETFIPEQERASSMRPFNQLLSGESQPFYESVLLTKNGEKRLISWNTTLLRDKYGTSMGTMSIGEDITERKQVEQALCESEKRYRMLAENISDVIWTMDMNLQFTYHSPSTINLRGYTPEEALTLNLEETLTLDSFKTAMKVFVEEMAIEKMEQKDLYRSRTVELEVVRKDGSTVWTEDKMTFLRDADGQTLGIMGVTRDITERKRAEEQLLYAVQEWKTTFDSITDLVSVHDKDYKIVRANKALADTCKMTPQEIIGKKCYELFHGTKQPWPGCPHHKAIVTQKPAREELFEPRLGLWLEVSASPIFTKEGEIIGSVHAAKNITERKKAEQEKEQLQAQLIQSEKMAGIGTLAAGVAHEFNNLLQIISGYIEFVQTIDKSTDMKNALDIIEETTGKATRIVRDLLSFSKPEPPKKQTYSITELIESVLVLIEGQLAKHDIRLLRQYEKVPIVWVNKSEIQQVFLNMISNARDAMVPEGGQLTIGVRQVNKNLEISFRDTGHGITKEQLNKLFEPFYTTKGALGGSDIPGTGLGLFVSYGIIKRHGGKIEAKSKPGQGTTFIITLPESEKKPLKTREKTKDKIPT